MAESDVAVTEDDKVKRVVVLVPGIREFGEWMTVVGAELIAAGFSVANTSISYFNVIQFLSPWPWRQQAVAKIREDIETVQLRYPNAEVSIIAHSFGSYCVAQVLKTQFRFRANRVIFCGSVLAYNFPFNQINNRFKAPILNDVGTADIWPALAQAVTVGYGAAGTRGFGNPLVEDRFHNHKKHGYFFEPGFCSDYWVPFLTTGKIVSGDSPRASPPWFIRLILIFQVKYLLGLLLALALAYGILSVAYPRPQLSVRASADPAATEGTRGFYDLGSAIKQIHKAAAIDACPMPKLLCDLGWVRQAVLGRDYKTMVVYTNELASIIACQPFTFPPDGTTTPDPYPAMRAVSAQFSQCMSLDEGQGGISWTATIGGAGLETVPAEQGAPFQLCGCPPEDVARFKQSYPGVAK